MNYSVEEIFIEFGQYDKFVSLEFEYGSDEYQKFGVRLMGNFYFEMDDRVQLENMLEKDELTRTDGNIRFIPSELENLTDEEKTDLDKNGILSSSIYDIYTVSQSNLNRFKKQGKKEIPNVLYVKTPDFGGWQELNRMKFGLLNSRYNKGKELSPHESILYWAFRIHFKINLESKDFQTGFTNRSLEFKTRVHLEELRLKYQELTISEKELSDFVKLVSEEIKLKNKIIDKEIARSTEKLSELAKTYGTELENLRKICLRFDEKVIYYGNKIIFLDFERFVHIYARHVEETQIGEKFNSKTVFQYKFDDILRVIRMVIESNNKEIEEHFKVTPHKSFRRMGKRSVYFDGHYYRIEIEPSGRLKDFHPFNDDRNIGIN